MRLLVADDYIVFIGVMIVRFMFGVFVILKPFYLWVAFVYP